MTHTARDQFWMQQALLLAEQAKLVGEVPVGAVLVHNDELIAQGYNCPIRICDPTAHAEIIVLRKAAQQMNNYRLPHTTLYVTLEPCMMCAGAIVHARIKRLVYGAKDAKAGAIASKSHCLDHAFLNHHVEYVGGLLEDKCGAILSAFFREKRAVHIA